MKGAGWPGAALIRRAPALGLLGLVLLVLRDAAFRGRVFYERDLHLQWFGQAEAFVRMVAAGVPPLWDAGVSFGQPFLANANTQVFYPFTWLNLLLRPWTFYAAYLGAHLLLLGSGVYALGRRLGLARFSAWSAAAVAMLSGPALSLGNLWNHLGAFAWLPWALVASEAAFGRRPGRAVLLWAASLAAALLAGSPDMAAMAALLSAANAARHAARDGPWRVAGRRALLSLGGAVALAAVAAGAQVLPSLELALRSGRGAGDHALRSYWSLHPAALAQAAVPLEWSALSPSRGAGLALAEAREPLLLSVYLGLPALGLALAGLLLGGRGGMRGLLATAAAAGIVVALGRYTPAYEALLAVLPPLRLLRFPAKAMVLTALATGALAGMGVEAIGRGAPRGRLLAWTASTGGLALAIAGGLAAAGLAPAPTASPWLSVAAALAVAAAGALGLRWPRRAGLLARCAALVAVADLAVAHRGLNPTAPREFFRYRPPALDGILQDDQRRLFVVDYQADTGLSQRLLGRSEPYLVPSTAGRRPPPWVGALALRTYPIPPVASAWGFAQSYSRDLLGIQPRGLALLNAAAIRSLGSPAHLRLLRLGAVGHVLTLHDAAPEGLVAGGTAPGPFLEPIRIYRVPDPLPRAYAVSGVRVADGAAAVAELLSASFDPTREIVLPEGSARAPDAAFAAAARIVDQRPDRVRLDIEASGPGHAVLVDAHDPGWRASVDGAPAPLLRANLAFRAVPIPAGRHVVEMAYRPASLTVGLALSAAALASAGALWARAR